MVPQRPLQFHCLSDCGHVVCVCVCVHTKVSLIQMLSPCTLSRVYSWGGRGGGREEGGRGKGERGKEERGKGGYSELAEARYRRVHLT